MKVFSLIALLMLSGFALAADPVWIDVRTAGEFKSGHLEVATNIPFGDVAEEVPALVSDKEAPVYLYCRSGNRAGKAKKALEAEGYTNVKNVGGLDDARALYSEMNAAE